jgi:hypothetical protein
MIVVVIWFRNSEARRHLTITGCAQPHVANSVGFVIIAPQLSLRAPGSGGADDNPPENQKGGP